MIGEICRMCGSEHTHDNPVVFDYGMLLCLDCDVLMDEAEKAAKEIGDD